MIPRHETEVLARTDANRTRLERTRVPGGWVYTTYTHVNLATSCFVPDREVLQADLADALLRSVTTHGSRGGA